MYIDLAEPKNICVCINNINVRGGRTFINKQNK